MLHYTIGPWIPCPGLPQSPCFDQRLVQDGWDPLPWPRKVGGQSGFSLSVVKSTGWQLCERGEKQWYPSPPIHVDKPSQNCWGHGKFSYQWPQPRGHWCSFLQSEKSHWNKPGTLDPFCFPKLHSWLFRRCKPPPLRAHEISWTAHPLQRLDPFFLTKCNQFCFLFWWTLKLINVVILMCIGHWGQIGFPITSSMPSWLVSEAQVPHMWYAWSVLDLQELKPFLKLIDMLNFSHLILSSHIQCLINSEQKIIFLVFIFCSELITHWMYQHYQHHCSQECRGTQWIHTSGTDGNTRQAHQMSSWGPIPYWILSLWYNTQPKSNTYLHHCPTRTKQWMSDGTWHPTTFLFLPASVAQRAQGDSPPGASHHPHSLAKFEHQSLWLK